MTETGQVPAAGIALVHPFDPRLKPAPVTFTTGAANSTLLLLVSVTVCGSDSVPAGILPKLIFLRDNATARCPRAADRLGWIPLASEEISLSAGGPPAIPLRLDKAAHVATRTAIERDEITRHLKLPNMDRSGGLITI